MESKRSNREKVKIIPVKHSLDHYMDGKDFITKGRISSDAGRQLFHDFVLYASWTKSFNFSFCL